MPRWNGQPTRAEISLLRKAAWARARALLVAAARLGPDEPLVEATEAMNRPMAEALAGFRWRRWRRRPRARRGSRAIIPGRGDDASATISPAAGADTER
jgi:hypothetical protein